MSTVIETMPPAKMKLIDVAAALVYRQGWNATGINQILSESRVPKGSFYYYFQSKDDLGAAIVRYHSQRLQDCYRRTLRNAALTGRSGFERFFEEQLVFQRSNEWRYGCPLGSFCNEVAATTEKIAVACREGYQDSITAIADAVDRGQRDGTVVEAADSLALAVAIASAWQGGLLQMKTFQAEEPLRHSLAWIERGLYRH